MRAFVTGTGTGVGKTYVTAILTRALRRAGFDTIALKPVCSGDRSDAELLREAADREIDIDEVNPYWFASPLAPLVAARAENRKVSLAALADWFAKISSGRKSVLVEGAGGWLVPVADRVTVADVCAAMALPVIVVAANRLGCVNHALLTAESIRGRNLKCLGFILNSPDDQSDGSSKTNRALIEEFSGLPVLFEIAHGQDDVEIAVA